MRAATFCTTSKFNQNSKEESDSTQSKTVKYQEHTPCSYAYKVVSDIPDYQSPVKHELCEDAAEKFLDEMKEVSEHIMTEYKNHNHSIVN